MQINTGLVVVPIERDGERVGDLKFRPTDGAFARRYMAMLSNIDEKQKEFIESAKEIDDDESTGPCGIPNKDVRAIELMESVADFMCTEIDNVFGAGTSDMVFGGVRSTSAILQFLSGINDYFAAARAAKMAQYAPERR